MSASSVSETCFMASSFTLLEPARTVSYSALSHAASRCPLKASDGPSSDIRFRGSTLFTRSVRYHIPRRLFGPVSQNRFSAPYPVVMMGAAPESQPRDSAEEDRKPDGQDDSAAVVTDTAVTDEEKDVDANSSESDSVTSTPTADLDVQETIEPEFVQVSVEIKEEEGQKSESSSEGASEDGKSESEEGSFQDGLSQLKESLAKSYETFKVKFAELLDSIEVDPESAPGKFLENLKAGQPSDISWVLGQVGLIVAVLFLPSIWHSADFLLYFLFGPIAIVAGLAVAAYGVTSISLENLTPYPSPTPDNQLITTGPYAWVRHPMYSGLLLAFFGLSVVTSSPTRLVATMAFFFFINAKINREEQALSKKHPGYAEYSKKVKKLIPFIF
eukprot:CAMPEP_0196659566 /NCGR_PEP_ID=MMETSP1086-20130531/35638_1 /TAXON_ID=77921 /ORGANISM="Cyanoptyche  gloeocystis , Strain SAG4.97" /LENGTH=386 /DNA_ID=CAMNT_0041993603 /DNA_START=40 /DNA_END=1200 /DNA_ORIENTATION=+